jgi:hypothetical protein
MWGDMHAEVLCTASSDHTFKMWSLTPGTIPVRNTYESFAGTENEFSPRFICSGAEEIGQWSGSSTNPVFVGEDIEPCHSPVVQSECTTINIKCYCFQIVTYNLVRPSHHLRNLFYCITRDGQLASLNVRRNTRDSLVPHM